ncbi:MAG TPA: DUF1501 domain-containing protein [Candidatus Bipolaricaulota bacterium]
MAIKRRQFIKRGVTFVSLSLATSHMMMQTSNTGNSVFAQASNLSGENRMLVVVQLGGGNDGLNTVVPYGNGLYYDARPMLAIPQEQVLALDNQIGLNPNLKTFKSWFDEGKLAVVQGVGYPNPNRSHFRSTDIWETANPETVVGTGWLGRYLDRTLCENDCTNQIPAAAVGGLLPLSLRGEQVVVPSIANLETFQFQTNQRYPQDRQAQVDAITAINEVTGNGASYDALVANTGLTAIRNADTIQTATANYSSAVEYPQNPFASGLQLLAKLIAGGLSTQIMHVSIGGFDTHSQQAQDHVGLLQAVDTGLAAFYQDLVQMGVADDVLLMTFSEFGRRVRENGSLGTDHGTAAPMFVMGNPAQGGLFGAHPSLNASDLDDNEDMVFQVDFRSVYSTVLESWLGVEPTDVLGARYENLGFVK